MSRLDIVPLPQFVSAESGELVLTESTRIASDGSATAASMLLQEYLRKSTEFRFDLVPKANKRYGDISLTIDPEMARRPEGYMLRVDAGGLLLSAGTLSGLRWGVQTIRQLLPVDLLRSAATGLASCAIPCVTIDDSPRFPWRGVLLDVARHFMPKEFVLKMVDLAALHRLNVFHFHLADDQGWRIKVPAWPKLVSVGAWRTRTAQGPVGQPTGYCNVPHGGYYSEADLREIVAYAARRSVTVMPEVGFPGHVQAAVSAYPALGQCGEVQVRSEWGHSEHVLAPNELALRFVRDVLTTLVDVFPSEYIHIGGDECPRTEWRTSVDAQRRARELGLGSTDALQSWFLRYGVDVLESLGRRAVGWDQVMEDGGVPQETLVMAWRDFAGDLAAQALTAGHDVVQCPSSLTYLDHGQSELRAEPFSFYGITPFADLINYDPSPPSLQIDGGAKVIGTQAHLWTEYMPTPRDVEYMAFPRLAAIAEAAWSSREVRIARPLSLRLDAYLARLEALGVGYRPLSGPLPWQSQIV